MTRRDLRLAREIELTQAPALPPLAQHIADGSLHRIHVVMIAVCGEVALTWEVIVSGRLPAQTGSQTPEAARGAGTTGVMTAHRRHQ